ncbi:MAG: hypothetical protein CMP23_08095 [Rickettsiales bacterium]|nr:hypothetical protein [Rickettsiales bacterium]|tara:strand:+ start:301 stop:1917 length:1617 start_codon:yes stop_codon:yes gene_type:complete
MHRTWATLLSGMLLVLGAWFRIDQLPFHQNLWAIDWLGYYEEQARDLHNFNLLGYLFRWEGLHPPLSGILHGGMSALGLGLPMHWAATVAAGLIAPLLLGLWATHTRSGLTLLLCCLWVALSPLQANYGLNTTPYPWLLLLVAASSVTTLGLHHSSTARNFLVAGLLAAAAIQVHVLALAAIAAQGLFLLTRGPSFRPARGRPAMRWWAPVLVSGALLCWNAISMTRDPWTFHVAEAEGGWLEQVLLALSSRFGEPRDKLLLVVITSVGLLLSLRPRTRLTAGLLIFEAAACLAALALFFELGVADPRLVHYYALPQLLLLAAAAQGWAELAATAQKASLRWSFAALPLLLSLPWMHASWEWNQQRQLRAEQEIATSAGEQVRELFAAAGDGDVVAYLWDSSFLNDESDHLDPVAARWPTARLGRPCFDVEMPPLHCNEHRGSHFFFAPNAHTGRDGDTTVPFSEMEESFRRMVNLSEAPGQARFIIAPGPEAAPRPWPMEAWFSTLGMTEESSLPGGLVVFALPVGARAEAPPPMHP